MSGVENGRLYFFAARAARSIGPGQNSTQPLQQFDAEFLHHAGELGSQLGLAIHIGRISDHGLDEYLVTSCRAATVLPRVTFTICELGYLATWVSAVG
jgi:hypothetical protein